MTATTAHQKDTTAAIVVTHNRCAILSECLDGLLGQTIPLNEIWVVDNASSDGTAELLESSYPTVKYVRLDRNVGPEAAIAEVMPDLIERVTWVWGFDDDSVVIPTALEQLQSVANQYHPAAVGITIGGVLRRGVPRHGERLAVMSESVRAVEFCVVDGSLIRSGAIRVAGLPRKDLFIMMADVEFMSRIAHLAGQVLVVDAPLIARGQLGGRSAAGYSPAWRDYYQARNHLLIVRASGAFADVLNVVGWQLKLAVGCLLTLKGHKGLMRLRGILDGMRGRSGETVRPPS